MKDLIRRLFDRLGYRVTSATNAGSRYVENPPQNTLQSIVFRNFRDLRGLNFVQVGANDGRRADPIVMLIERYAWTGVMLEPLPVYFRALQARHGRNPRLTLLQAALDTSSGNRLIYHLAECGADLPDWSHGLASLERRRLEEAARELHLPDAAIAALPIKTVTWDDVWSHLKGRPCDLLVLDTEGHDLILLRAANLATRRPRLIHFEHGCASPDDRLAFYRELLDLGYEIATDGPDTTAWLPARPA